MQTKVKFNRENHAFLLAGLSIRSMKAPAKSAPTNVARTPASHDSLHPSPLVANAPDTEEPSHPVWIVQRTISGRWVVERPSPPMSVRFAERSEAVAFAYAETRRLGGGRIVVMPVRVRTRNYYTPRS